MSAEAFETEGMSWQERVEWADQNGQVLSGTYVLSAERDGGRVVKVLRDCADDTEATFRGMTYILNTACKEQGARIPFWSKGRIELRDPDGELVQEMEAKP